MPPNTGPVGSLDSPSSTKVGGRLMFPTTYGEYSGNWVLFDRMKYSKVSLNTPAKPDAADGARTVALPLPAQLATTYSVGWENRAIGIAGNQMSNAVGAAAKDFQTMLANKTSVSDMVKTFGSGIRDGILQYGLNNAIDGITGSNPADIALGAVGVAKNPYQAALFQGPSFRTFNFSWKLFASNEGESDTIKDIIREFKTGMSPEFQEGSFEGLSFGDNLFKYPDMWNISFSDNEHLFKIHYCVLKEVSVDYHGEGAAIYHMGRDGKKKPASVIVTTEFQEIKILTRADIVQGY